MHHLHLHRHRSHQTDDNKNPSNEQPNSSTNEQSSFTKEQLDPHKDSPKESPKDSLKDSPPKTLNSSENSKDSNNKKVIVIVGAGPGIGTAVGVRFAKEGYSVALLARTKESLELFEKEVIAAGAPSTLTVSCDAGSLPSIQEAFLTVKDKLGEPEVVVYNAALMSQKKLIDASIEEIEASNKINLYGALQCIQHVVQNYMRKSGSGTIMVTGQGLALNNFSPYGILGLGKAALRAAIQALNQELTPEGIHVATITICGFVKPGTSFDPALIADEYWYLYKLDPTLWTQWELVYQK